MLYNYFKIAWRNLFKHKENSLVHIIGLTIGLSGSLLIGLFVLDEMNFDSFHPDSENTYRIYSQRDKTGSGELWASTSPAIGPNLKADFPEIHQTMRLFRIRQKQLFNYNGEIALEEKGIFSESSIFEIFDLPLLHGDHQTALSDINSVVLTYPLAQKYFGNDNPVGKSILINNSEKLITGVLKPLNKHFHLDFKFLVSFQNLLSEVTVDRINSWIWQDFYNYVQFVPNTNIPLFQEKLSKYIEKHAHVQTKESGFVYYLYIQKLKDIHLHSANFRNDIAVRGDYKYIIGLSLVGLFLMLIACINFINLTTAKAFHRSKEVGIRKATGADRSQLAFQFIFESIFLVAISMLLAAQLCWFLVPYLNEFSGKSIAFNWYKSPGILSLMIAITLLTGFLAGAYPAFVLSGFNPVKALKGTGNHPSGNVQYFRKALVTLQFTLSIMLMICVLVIYEQVNFLNHKDLGFQSEQLLTFPMKEDLYRDFQATKSEFLKVPGVLAASTCFGIPGDIVSGDNIIVPDQERKTLPARIFTVDHEYLETMGMTILSGRGFSKEISTDATEAFIINESAVRLLSIADNIEQAIGKTLEWEGWDEKSTIKKGKIIGVVKDFHYNSLHEEVGPAVLHIYPDAYWKLALRIEGSNPAQTINGINETWEKYNTGYPLDFQFVDEGFGAMYQSERKLNSLLWVFTILAIIISCIGAFGLAAFSAEKRLKEIGIRKVLGASTESIVFLLNKDFLILVIFALILASPFSWYVMTEWLSDFAYRIEMQWWYFALTGFIALFIAFITISFQSIKGALSNPVEVLKS